MIRWLVAAAWMALAPCADAESSSDCRLCAIELKQGMPRSEVEKKVAAALGRESAYSAYGKNLRGGIVEYRDGKWTLTVTYKPGSPAPWIVGKDGVAQHIPPVDESVLSYDVKVESRPR